MADNNINNYNNNNINNNYNNYNNYNNNNYNNYNYNNNINNNINNNNINNNNINNNINNNNNDIKTKVKQIFNDELKNNSEGIEVNIWILKGDNIYVKKFLDGSIRVIYASNGNPDTNEGYGIGTYKYKNIDGFNVYEGDFVKGEREGQGTMTFANGDVYEGSWRDDLRAGQGKMKFANGDVYEGSWRDDLRAGRGKMKFANGDVYEGTWEDNLYSSMGTFTWSDGSKYEGEWNVGKKNGQGTYTWPNGDTYEGDWKDDFGEGFGTYYYKNENGNIGFGSYIAHKRQGFEVIYNRVSKKFTIEEYEDGIRVKNVDNAKEFDTIDELKQEFSDLGCNEKYIQFVEGKIKKLINEKIIIESNDAIQKKVEQTFNDLINHPEDIQNLRENEWSLQGSNIYAKKFSDGCIRVIHTLSNDPDEGEGYGMENYKDEDGNDDGKYEGKFKNGRRDCFGTYTWPDGTKYEGNFKNNKIEIEGYGKMTYEDGDVYEGDWKNGKRDGLGTYTCSDGKKYEGYWKEGNQNGFGIFTWPNGRKYAGNFKNNKIEGYGRMTYEDGDKYEGYLANSNREGFGTYYYKNGNIGFGFYTAGKRQGFEVIYNRVSKKFTIDKYEDGTRIENVDNATEFDTIDALKQKLIDLECNEEYIQFVEGKIKKIIEIQKKVEQIFNYLTSHPEDIQNLGENKWSLQGSNIYAKKFSDGTIRVIYTQNGIPDEGIYGMENYKDEDGILFEYEGEFKNGLRDGFGTIIHPNGEKYEGNWVNSVREGKGKMIYKNGGVYEGDWKNGKPNGFGTYTWPDGTKYEGGWNEGKKNGQGTYTWPDGDVYEGDWKDDLIRDGFGTYYYKKNGNIGFSLYMKNKKQGFEVIYNSVSKKFTIDKYEDGTRVENVDNAKEFDTIDELKQEFSSLEFNEKYIQFVEEKIKKIIEIQKKVEQTFNDLINHPEDIQNLGENKWSLQGSNIYAKKFSDGTIRVIYTLSNDPDEGEGYGMENYKDEDGNDDGKYEGKFKNGRRDGFGTIIHPNGAKYEGNWVNSVREGKGKMIYKNGSVYEGDWKNGKPNGFGTYTWPDGTKYEGNWQNNHFEGEGIYYYPNDDIGLCSFKNGLQQGFEVKYNSVSKKFTIDEYEDGTRVENVGNAKEFDTIDELKRELSGLGCDEKYIQFVEGKIKKLINEKIIIESNDAIQKKVEQTFNDLINHPEDIQNLGKNEWYSRGGNIYIMKRSDDTISVMYYYTLSNNSDEICYGMENYKDKDGNDGGKYEGGFKDNQKDGFGIYYYSSDDIGLCSFKNNLQQGFEVKYNKEAGNYEIHKYKDGKEVEKENFDIIKCNTSDGLKQKLKKLNCDDGYINFVETQINKLKGENKIIEKNNNIKLKSSSISKLKNKFNSLSKVSDSLNKKNKFKIMKLEQNHYNCYNLVLKNSITGKYEIHQYKDGKKVEKSNIIKCNTSDDLKQELKKLKCDNGYINFVETQINRLKGENKIIEKDNNINNNINNNTKLKNSSISKSKNKFNSLSKVSDSLDKKNKFEIMKSKQNHYNGYNLVLKNSSTGHIFTLNDNFSFSVYSSEIDLKRGEEKMKNDAIRNYIDIDKLNKSGSNIKRECVVKFQDILTVRKKNVVKFLRNNEEEIYDCLLFILQKIKDRHTECIKVFKDKSKSFIRLMESIQQEMKNGTGLNIGK